MSSPAPPVPTRATRTDAAEAVAADLTGLLLPYFDPSYGGSTASCCGYTATVDCGPAAERTDACCYVVTVSSRQCWSDGRPFRVDGRARMAELRSGSPWAAAARAEHASVASFARFALELMALGAPLELLRGAARAMADEVEHAAICAARAGVAPDFGPPDVVGALGSVQARDVLVATLRDGAIGETLAAPEATAGAFRADAGARAALLQIAADETRHAALAWRTVRWILASRPELVDVARATIVAPVPGTDGLLLTAAERRDLAIATFATVIGPLAAAVFGEPTRAPLTPTGSNREQSKAGDARWPRSAPFAAASG